MHIKLSATVGVAVIATLVTAGCGSSNYTAPGASTLGNPDSLTYVLIAGAPGVPSGVELQWAPATDVNVVAYDVFARQSVSGSWGEIGSTVLSGFDDLEEPSLEYYVASQDAYGDLSSGTAALTVDTLDQLATPTGLTGTPLNAAAELTWSPVASTDTATFSYYKVYSEASSSGSCAAGFTLNNLYLEGSTASEAFVISGLTNTTPYCYAVSVVATTGQESQITGWVLVTPDASDASLDAVLRTPTTVVAHGAERRIAFARVSRTLGIRSATR